MGGLVPPVEAQCFPQKTQAPDGVPMGTDFMYSRVRVPNKCIHKCSNAFDDPTILPLLIWILDPPRILRFNP